MPVTTLSDEEKSAQTAKAYIDRKLSEAQTFTPEQTAAIRQIVQNALAAAPES